MKKNMQQFLWASVIVAGLFTSCKKDDHDHDHDEEELITTLRVQLTNTTTNATQTFTFRDTDGPGGNAPTVDSILIAPNATFNCSIQVLNESVTPAEDKTPEIIREANDHQFYFITTGTTLAITNLNNDSRSLPFGLTSTWTTGAAGAAGTVRIALKHKPGQKAAGDPITKGETDIDVTFGVRVR